MAELDCQVKLAEQYKSNLDAVQHIHCKSQEEAGKMKGVLLAKETDLSRMLTAVQLASNQVGVASHVGRHMISSYNEILYFLI